ncbi:hypothetical protein Tco_0405882, partial [Tanacetum coccineum]
ASALDDTKYSGYSGSGMYGTSTSEGGCSGLGTYSGDGGCSDSSSSAPQKTFPGSESV